MDEGGGRGADAPVVVIGAGIGGLATTLRLAAAGVPVVLLERADAVGGKMRAAPSAAGPVDAGPTVLTLRHVLDALFEAAGERLEDHATLEPEPILARHHWSDGATMDLHADPEASALAVRDAFGPAAEAGHRRHAAAARRLFEAFDAPMMRAAEPSAPGLAARVMREPRLLADMAPGRTLAGALAARIPEPRLRQLHGRYATYVGGSPHHAPALLGLISHAESLGVWRVRGGLHALARALAALAERLGAAIRLGCPVAGIEVADGRATAVRLTSGERIAARAVVHAGDPRALASGLLGAAARSAVGPLGRPSLSARVWAFAATVEATPGGMPLAHHTVLFGPDDGAEFAALAAGRPPPGPTLYVCAQDRGWGRAPQGPERFEIIMNAPPSARPTPEEDARCQETMLHALRAHGLRLAPEPLIEAMTPPQGFAALAPGSEGALYGAGPGGPITGLAAALRRPRARSRMPGLYLAGGGAHPGAGVPMAASSGRHAAEAITADLASTSRSPRGATAGGTSTRWRTARARGAAP